MPRRSTMKCPECRPTQKWPGRCITRTKILRGEDVSCHREVEMHQSDHSSNFRSMNSGPKGSTFSALTCGTWMSNTWEREYAARFRRMRCAPRNATVRLAREHLADEAGDHRRAFRGRREYRHDGAACPPRALRAYRAPHHSS